MASQGYTRCEMAAGDSPFIGVGLYTVPQAARISHVSTGRIRRWLLGYTYETTTGRGSSPPVVTSSLPLLDGTLTLTFLDLQEIRFVDAFIEAGVKWQKLRFAHSKLQQAWGPYPFSRGRFVTDGRTILEDLAPGARTVNAHLVDVITNQTAFKQFVWPYIKNLAFANGQASQWWPLGKSKMIVLDPLRSFGQPIVAREGVPTAILAKAYRAEQSYARVARWYEVKERWVRNAVEYESTFAA
jgi:uncharacterized protein (DUF433 family)